jgi:hypothetical protein
MTKDTKDVSDIIKPREHVDPNGHDALKPEKGEDTAQPKGGEPPITQK